MIISSDVVMAFGGCGGLELEIVRLGLAESVRGLGLRDALSLQQTLSARGKAFRL